MSRVSPETLPGEELLAGSVNMFFAAKEPLTHSIPTSAFRKQFFRAIFKDPMKIRQISCGDQRAGYGECSQQMLGCSLSIFG